ncbi:MAG TPA: DUF1573 domain-containing protein [Polyangia bacterium]|nr:DUF1573 domain-containing protein [Polyangia bacterium]
MRAVPGKLVLAAMLGLGLALVGGCGKKSPEAGDASVAKQAGPPRIVAPEPAFNAGKVKQGENVEHVFKVKNEGQAELVLEKAKSS